MSQLLFSLENSLVEKIIESIKDSKSIWIITAYLEDSGFCEISKALESADENCEINLITSDSFDCEKNKEIIEFFTKSKNAHLRITNNPEKFLHIKLYLFIKKDFVEYITGSSNLTYSGLNSNIELNLYDKVNCKSDMAVNLLSIVEKIHAFSTPVSLLLENRNISEKFKGEGVFMTTKLTKEMKEKIANEAILWIEAIKRGYFNEVYKIDVYDCKEFLTEEWIGTKNYSYEFRKEVSNDGIKYMDLPELKHLWNMLWAVNNLGPRQKNDLLTLISKNSKKDIEKMFAFVLHKIDTVSTDDDIKELYWFVQYKENGDKLLGFGESVATEILFWLAPEKFPIKNRKTNIALCYIMDLTLEQVENELKYQDYYHIVIEIWDVLSKILEEKGECPEDSSGKFRYVDVFSYYLWCRYNEVLGIEKDEEAIERNPMEDKIKQLLKKFNQGG
jgi:HKD family nuclease